MSRTERMSFEVALPADRYLREVLLDEAFTEALYREGLEFPDYEVLQWSRGDGGAVDRRLRLCPPSNAPRVVQKVLGRSQQYEERGRFDPSDAVWRFEVIPAAMSNRIQVRGTQRARALGDDRCRVEIELTVGVSILGVGGAIEKFMASQFADHTARQRTFTERWLRAR